MEEEERDRERKERNEGRKEEGRMQRLIQLKWEKNLV